MTEREREALMRLTMCARNECVVCKYKDSCDSDVRFEFATKNMNILAEALRKTEPTISKMEQVDKDINVRSKDELQTEPLQTCSVNGRPYNECSYCEHFRCTADEPQTNKGVSYSDHTDYDEPKTYVTWTEPTDCPWK